MSFGLAGITLPIFDQNQGGIKQAEAKRKEAAVRIEALQDRILGDLAHALARYEASIEALRLSDEHLASARRQLDSQAAAFSSGNADRLTFTQAKADYQTSETTRLDAEVAVQQAAGALEDAMQQPLARDTASRESGRTTRQSHRGGAACSRREPDRHQRIRVRHDPPKTRRLYL